MIFPLRSRGLALVVTSVLASALAAAQPAPAPPGPPAPVVVPPRLVTFVEATYPPDAARTGLGASVDLAITVGADGTVTLVTVIAPVGNGFDEAAIAAAKQFRFEPATRDGKPLAARIKYRYVFELKPAVTAPDPDPGVPITPGPAPRGVLRGRVLETKTGAPLAGVDVTVRAAGGGEPITVITDASGRFVIPDLAPDTYNVRVVTFEAGELSASESVVADEELDVTYRLVRVETEVEVSGDEYGATATVEAPSREVTRRSIAREEMVKMPGTRGDALRGIELLPGVAKPPGGLGALIVRGAAPGDSEFYLDGSSIPGIYHFGGLTSFVNGQLLDRIELYPGNFSVRYGRRIGAIVEANLRDPDPKKPRGVVDINMIDASLVLETPITDTIAIAIAGRRSYIDFWFDSVIPDDVISVQTAPVYDDYQLMAVYKPNKRDRFRLFGYGSRDRLALFLDEPADGDPAIRGNLGFSTAFHRVQAEWRRKISPTTELELRASGGTTSFDIALGDSIGVDVSGLSFASRGELRTQLSSRVALNLGYDVAGGLLDITFNGPRIRKNEGQPDMGGPLSSQEFVSLVSEADIIQPAIYAETVIKATTGLEITAGLRGDYFGATRATNLDPRLSAKYIAGDTTYKAAVGRFSQPPDFGQTDETLGNPDLDPTHAIHYGLGVDRRLTARANVGAEAFYKSVDGLIVDNRERTMLVNAGLGRIYGLELSARLQPGGPISGFLSYTWSRSQRNDLGEEWRSFDYDQSHILSVAASAKLGRKWQLGGAFRLASGNPETPVAGSLYNANFDYYQPLYGKVNSTRAPVFHRLDVRIERRFEVASKLRWFVYLDLQNAYNNQSIEGTQFNYDYRKSQPVLGLPVLPSLGFRGEL